MGVIRALITPEIYKNPEHTSFFNTRERVGLGLLYPDREEQDSKVTSTLELHRRALRLEWVGESLLRILADSARAIQGGVSCLLSKAFRDDLEAAFRFHGGIPGEGVDYWLPKPDGGLPR